MVRMRRVACLLLTLVMVIGMLPMSVFATENVTETAPVAVETISAVDSESGALTELEDPEVVSDEAETLADGETTYTYVLAGSDFQASNHDAGATIVKGLLDKIKVGYPTMNGFLFAGDYDVNHNDSANGKAKLQETVQDVYGTGMDEIYVQGNHDNDNLVGSTLTASGANDAENYGVFVINEKDYMWYNDDEATIKKTAENLEAYLNAKRNAGYTKPIFVMSHLPLHYCMRTRSGGKDGMHANYIFDVLNEAGNAGLNIIFMFGHNHSHGWDDYLGGAAIFLTKGNKINIAQNSTTVFEEETLAFTYMNAGYVGYYGTSYTSDVDKTLTMTTFAITDSNVTISRYDSNGTHDLKSAGVYNVEYPDSAYYSTDTTTVGTPYILTLNTEITPAGEEVEPPTGGNTGSGTTNGRTYTRVTSTSELVSGGQYLIIYNGSHFMLPEVVEKSDGSVRKGFNVESTSVCGPDTITGDYTAKEWTLTSSGNGWLLGNGTQYAKLTNTSNYKITATLENSGDVFTIGGSENAFTFSNGTYVLNYNDRGLINGYASNAAPFYIYRLTNEGSSGGSVDTTGGDWVTITEPTTGGTKYVYELDTNGVDTGVEYLIVANSYPKALSAAASSNNAVDIEISDNYAYANSDTYGWTFTPYSYGVYYIRLNNSTYLALSSNAIGSSNSAGSSRRWTVTSNNDGSYDIVRNDYNLRWSNSNGVFQVSNSNEGPVRLYKYLKTENTTAQAGLYGKISGELTYNVANGTSKEDALAAVKAGIDILYHNGDANAAQVFPDDGEGMTWTLDESYNGTTGGEYAVTIAYNGVTLGVAKVVVPSVNITGYSVEPAEGTVNKGASQAAQTGALIYVQLENGKYYTVPVTVSMLTKADGSSVSTGEATTHEKLTLTYNGVKITENFTLNVVAKTGNNYPEYPNEGAVKVNKTGTGIDFQSSGIAQVEISASGVPMKKGADVIVMLDLSSSMTNTVDGKTRLSVLEASLQSLMTQLQADGVDGQPMDIRIAVADFNRYYTDSSSPYYINSADHLINGSIRNNADGTNQIYTGTHKANAGAFVSVHDLEVNAFSGLSTKSGTNYDYAFDMIYQLGEAVTAQNATDGVERDLFVIFMSDGAPFQFNYFSAQSGSDSGTTDARYWNNWLQGTMTNAMFDSNARNDYYNEDGKHWMAEAIKGDPSSTYPVIRKNNAADTDGDTWVNVNGLGAKMYSIGFCLAKDKEITVNSMDTVIRNIATSEQYYFRANSAADLNNTFSAIGGDIAYAAYNARFVDQMGDNYNLQMKTSTYSVVDGASTSNKTLAPKIEIITYDIYTRQDFLNGTIAEDKIGDRKGTYRVLETVTFNTDGTEAYSDQIYTTDTDGNKVYTNILAPVEASETDGFVDGVIYATSFLYNTNANAVAVEGVSIPTGTKSDGTTSGSTNMLPSETFYWKMGTVQTSELAMRYYVYLDGSMEGHRKAGSYPTNNYATLYYDNYLHNPCKKDTVSPVLPWKEANVSYAFYLVNDKGEIIVNQTTGETGSFANKIAITNPVVFDSVLLNDEGAYLDVVTASQVLPDYYDPFDVDASYQVVANSNGSGSWTITGGKEIDGKTVLTTYVTGYDVNNSAAYTYEMNISDTVHDYTHTTVWFAVELVTQAHPDTVVIDYGLPVEISVLANDMFGEKGKLAGVGAITDSLKLNGYDTTLASGFNGYESEFGAATANVNTGKVTYTPSSMEMNTYDEFAYAVNYTGSVNPGYYYDTVTVIPATTIYYEDSFLDYNYYFTDDKGTTTQINDIVTPAGESKLGWQLEGTTVDAIQGEDRPGKYSITDANNIYGYDGVNKSMSTHSLGSAAKAYVNSTSYATAAFTFYGTGFDIISMTSNTTGVLAVKVTAADDVVVNGETVYAKDAKVKTAMINTYYGCSYEQTGVDENKQPVYGWVSKPDVDQAMYQVPIMQIEELPYGKYHVLMTATYNSALDEDFKEDVEGDDTEGYWLYLDAVRIYDPANDGAADGAQDTTIEDAYKQDGEGWPSYIELRNKLISKPSFGEDVTTTGDPINGLVFIDGDPSVGLAQIEDYKSYGPNNEVYLKSGQSVAFRLSNITDNVANIHIGIKSADGKIGKYAIKNVASADISASIKAGTAYGEKSFTVDTTTDMYYDLSAWKNDIIVISNTGAATDGIISITNIKATYNADPNGTLLTGDDDDTNKVRSVDPINNEVDVFMTYDSAALTLRAINGAEDQKPDAPQPEDPKPEETEPEETVPEETEPEVTEPETFDPAISVKLNKTSVKVGQKVQVKVTTSADVAYVTVNGETVTKYSVNRRTGERSWSVNVTAAEAGQMTIEVIAYNDADMASDAVIKTVNVTKKSGGFFGSFFGWIFG